MADDNSASQAQAQEEKGGIPSWIWILLAAAVAFFIFRKMGAKKKLTPNPYAPNSGANQAPFAQTPPAAAPRNDNTNIFGQPLSGGTNTQATPSAAFGATMNSGNALPDGTEPATFLRFARQRFNHIQAMNSGSNIDEIRKYFTTDMYQQMHQEIANNHDVAEFSNLTANVVEQATENGQYVVSVRFTGTVSEDLNSLPQPFTEIWHFVKTENSQEDWLVAGIQQV